MCNMDQWSKLHIRGDSAVCLIITLGLGLWVLMVSQCMRPVTNLGLHWSWWQKFTYQVVHFTLQAGSNYTRVV